jgi:hypothetical protein
VNKVDELDESVPIDVDRVVVIKARDDMEIVNDPVEVDHDPVGSYGDSKRSHTGRIGSSWRMINYATNDVHIYDGLSPFA